jgi:DNA-directed RNA polymerase subunit RPC12/RpoP
MGWIRRETEKGTTQYICPNCHDYHEFREDFGEQTFSENFIFCRRCGARNGTGTAPTLTPPNEWVNRVRELDELYTKLQIVTGFTAEQLLEIFAAGYTLEKPDYSKKFAEMTGLIQKLDDNTVAYVGDNGIAVKSKDGKEMFVDTSGLSYDIVMDMFRNLPRNGNFFSNKYWSDNIQKAQARS